MKKLTIESLKSDIEEAATKVDRLEKMLQDARFDLDSLRHVYQRYSEPTKKLNRVRLNLGIDPQELEGLSLEDALLRIARVNKGILISTPTRKLLEESGHLHGDQTGKDLWSTLKSSDQFEQISRGRYRLIESSSSSDSTPPA